VGFGTKSTHPGVPYLILCRVFISLALAKKRLYLVGVPDVALKIRIGPPGGT
jgi:hypothetical protein